MGAGGSACSYRDLRAYRCTASGANTTSSSADQPSTASSGCCIGQACTRADGLGLPNSSRHDAATALNGFQTAITCSQPGIPCVGTNALEMNVSGMNKMNASCCAASTLRSFMPRQTPAQLNA